MGEMRIKHHPILPIKTPKKTIPFFFNGKKITAYPGEMISSALFFFDTNSSVFDLSSESLD